MFRHILILLSMLCLPLPVAAQTLLGKQVMPKQIAPIRKAPPNGYLRFPGEELGRTNPSNRYIISDERIFQYLFSSQTWVHLKSQGQDDEPGGWAYWGETGTDASPNFEIDGDANNSSSAQE